MRWRNHDLGTWCLGTAQLGLDYGIANQHGQPSLDDSCTLIECATTGGVLLFDTATAYGESHRILGKCLAHLQLQNKALIITKLSDEELFGANAENLVKNALDELGIPQFFGLLAHAQSSMRNSEEAQRIFSNLKEKGLVKFSGISLYDAEDAKSALMLEHFDLIQLPLNVLDRSAVDSGLLELARKADKLLLFRSALLQGLLTLQANELPNHMQFAAPLISEWQDICKTNGLAPQELALQIAQHLADGFPLVIGAESPVQVEQNLGYLNSSHNAIDKIVTATLELAHRAPVQLRNPSQWPQAQSAHR